MVFQQNIISSSLRCMLCSRNHDATYLIDRRRIACSMYSSLDSARKIAFPLLASRTTVLSWVGSTERNKCIRFAPKSRLSQSVLAVRGRKPPIFHRMKGKSDDRSHNGRLHFSPVCSCGPENNRILSQKQSPSSPTAVFHRIRNNSVPGTLRSV